MQKFGIPVLPERYDRLNPMTHKAAVQMEVDLRRASLAVTSGHGPRILRCWAGGCLPARDLSKPCWNHAVHHSLSIPTMLSGSVPASRFSRESDSTPHRDQDVPVQSDDNKWQVTDSGSGGTVIK